MVSGDLTRQYLSFICYNKMIYVDLHRTELISQCPNRPPSNWLTVYSLVVTANGAPAPILVSQNQATFNQSTD